MRIITGREMFYSSRSMSCQPTLRRKSPVARTSSSRAERYVTGDTIDVFAQGEVTGHKHQFVFRDAEMFRGGAGQVLRVLKDGAPLQHEEHSPIEFPAGLYERPVQVEHTDEDEPRIVAD